MITMPSPYRQDPSKNPYHRAPKKSSVRFYVVFGALVVAIIISLAIALRASSDPDTITTAPAAATTSASATTEPGPITTTFTITRVQDIPAGHAYLGECCDIAKGSGLYRITFHFANTSDVDIPIPDGYARVAYGKTHVDAYAVATDGHQDTIVPAHDKATYAADFIVPDDRVLGAIVTTPFPEADGTDLSAPHQTIVITKNHLR